MDTYLKILNDLSVCADAIRKVREAGVALSKVHGLARERQNELQLTQDYLVVIHSRLQREAIRWLEAEIPSEARAKYLAQADVSCKVWQDD